MFKYCDETQGNQAVHITGNINSSKGGETTSLKQKTSQSGFGGYRLLYRAGSGRDIAHLTVHVCEGKKGALILMDLNRLCKLYRSFLSESCLKGS